MENPYSFFFFLENFIERDHAGDLDLDARSMLKMYCTEWCLVVTVVEVYSMDRDGL